MTMLHKHIVRVLDNPTPGEVATYLDEMSVDGWAYLGTLDIPKEHGLSLVFGRLDPDYWNKDDHA